MAKMGNAGASGGGMFAGLEPAQRAEIVQRLLSGITQSAGQSGSPLLAGISPILAAMIGGRAQAKANTDGSSARGSAGDRIFGNNEEARAMADLLAQEGLPDSYRRAGQKRLDEMLRSGGGVPRSAGGSSPSVPGQTRQNVADAATERGAIDTERSIVLGETDGDLMIRSPDGKVSRVPASQYPGLSVGDPVGPARQATPDILTSMLAPPAPAATTMVPETPLARPANPDATRLRYNPETGEFE